MHCNSIHQVLSAAPIHSLASHSVPLRFALIQDYAEENWPSMALVAEMLGRHLRMDHGDSLQTASLHPRFRRRLGHLPGLPMGMKFNADRILNRFWDYPRLLRRCWKDFDLFHICDHSYAHMVHGLPPARTGVYCHDLDAFRCLFEPALEPRPFWFKAMARRILKGLQKAAIVFYSTTPVRRQIEHFGLLDPARLIHAPYGIAEEFTPEPAEQDGETIQSVLPGDNPFLLHVGSCIPRKRIDVLLDVFAGLLESHPHLHLIQIGGQWNEEQVERIQRLRIGERVTQLRGVERQTMAAFYRKAALILVPSEWEGFGLPVIEALACGAIVVASDISVLREVGGAGAVYCPVAEVNAWVQSITRILAAPTSAPCRRIRIGQAQRFSWTNHAHIIAEAYLTRVGYG